MKDVSRNGWDGKYAKMLEREGTKVKLILLEVTIISKRVCIVIYRILYLPTNKFGIPPEEKI